MRAWLDRHGPPLLFLAAVALAFLYKVVLFGAWPRVGDVPEQFYPWEVFARRILADGQIPLWNPYNNCGMPFLANLQSSVFYPVEMLLLPLPAGPAIGWSTVFHLMIAGWGGYFMALRFGANRWGGALAGLAYMLNGFAMIHLFAGNTLTLYAAAWAPWAFLAAERAFQARGWRGYLLGGSAIWALHFLCGHAQMTFYSAVFATLYVLVRAGVSRKRSDVTALGKFFAAAVFGVLLASIQFIPTAEYAALSSRSGGLDYEAATEFSLPPNRIINFFLPDFFGSHADLPWRESGSTDHTFWAYWAGWSNNYVGVLTILLAALMVIFGLRRGRCKSPVALALTVVAVFAFFCAAGRFTPVYEWIFPLPGFRLFRAPSKFTPYLLLPLLVAAALGFSRFMGYVSRRQRASLIAPAGYVLIALGLVLLVGRAQAWLPVLGELNLALGDPEQNLRRMMMAIGGSVLHFSAILFVLTGVLRLCRSGKLPPGWTGTLLLLLLLADLAVFGLRYQRGIEPGALYPPGQWQELPGSNYARIGLADDFRYSPAPNHYLLFHREVTGAYDPLSVGRYVEFVADMQGKPVQFEDVLFAPLGKRGNILAGVSTAVDFFMPGVGLLTDVEYLPAPRSRFFPGNAETTDAQYPANPHRDLIVEMADGSLGKVGPVLPVTVDLQRLDKQGTTRLEFDAPAGGWLYLADVIYPGWVARDEFGTEYEIVPANHAFRAIKLPKGKHRITFSYEPISFRIGLWLTIGAGLVWLMLLLLEVRGRRKATADPPTPPS